MQADEAPSEQGGPPGTGAGEPEHSGRRVFGGWRFDAASGELDDGETTTQLQPQVAKLLAYFLDHQDRIVTRDELIAAVWENRIVSDDAIHRCVSILRKALAPNGTHACIETVARRGYLAHFPDAPERPPRPRRRRRLRAPAVLAALAAMILVAVFWNAAIPPVEVRETPAAKPPLVAILPFEFAGQRDDSEFFANGMHDDLLTRLAKLQSIRVISSTSVREYRGNPRNMRQIGDELGADAIMEGSVQVADTRIRVHAQLIDAREDVHLWAETFDRELSPENIFDVQSEIARAIVASLHALLTEGDDRQLNVLPTENMAAYRAYHRAMTFRDDYLSDLRNAAYRQYLEEAVALDPRFSRAWAELAINLAYLNMSGDQPALTRRAEWALENLRAVAPDSPEYLIGQAGYVYYALKDYDRAHEIIARAMEANPSDIRALELQSWIERRLGDFDAYLASKRAARVLDPRNPARTDSVLQALALTHRYDEVAAEIASAQQDTFWVEYFRIILSFREAQDYGRLADAASRLCEHFEVPECGWEFLVAARDFPQALASLGLDGEEAEEPVLRRTDLHRIFTYWLMKDEERLAEGMPEWQSRLDSNPAGWDQSGWDGTLIDAAVLAGAQGRADESRQLVGRWLRQQPVDWAERSGSRHEACRVLGMVGAARAAAECIRDGLEEASYVMPFWEPYLPFYDPIRREPEFERLLAEIGSSASR